MKKYAVIACYHQHASTHADYIVAECETHDEAIEELSAAVAEEYPDWTDDQISEAIDGDAARLGDLLLVIVFAGDFPDGDKPGTFEIYNPRASNTENRKLEWVVD